MSQWVNLMNELKVNRIVLKAATQWASLITLMHLTHWDPYKSVAILMDFFLKIMIWHLTQLNTIAMGPNSLWSILVPDAEQATGHYQKQWWPSPLIDMRHPASMSCKVNKILFELIGSLNAFYTPHNEVMGYIGYIGFTLSVCSSVCLSVILSCPPCSIYSSNRILSIFGTNDP